MFVCYLMKVLQRYQSVGESQKVVESCTSELMFSGQVVERGREVRVRQVLCPTAVGNLLSRTGS